MYRWSQYDRFHFTIVHISNSASNNYKSALCINTILHDLRGREKIELLFALINGYNFAIVKAISTAIWTFFKF